MSPRAPQGPRNAPTLPAVLHPSMPTDTSRRILLVAHGSRDPRALAECEATCHELERAGLNVDLAYLEISQPRLRDYLTAHRVDRPPTEILPLFSFPGSHVREDLPAIARDHGDPRILDPIGDHRAICDLVRAYAKAGLDSLDADPKAELWVVGHGWSCASSTQRFVSTVGDIGRDLGFREVRAVFHSLAEPSLQSLLAAASEGPPIVLVPFLLFHGRILDAIHSRIARARQTGARIVLQPHLAAHPGFATALIEILRAAR